MAFKLDVSKFKKLSADKHHTTLQHPEGHQIKISHSSLSPENRKALAKLPMMADGGQVADPTQEHLLPGDAVPNKIEKSIVARYDDGGDVDPKANFLAKMRKMKEGFDSATVQTPVAPPTPAPSPTSTPAADAPQSKLGQLAAGMRSAFAEGGEASDEDIIRKKKEIDDYNSLHEDEPKEYPQDVTTRMQQTDVTPPQKLADGGLPDVPAAAKPDSDSTSDIDYSKIQAGDQPYGTPPAPVVVNVGTSAAPATSVSSPQGMPVASSPEQAAQGPVQPTDVPAGPSSTPAGPQKQPAASSDQSQAPSTMAGYQQQQSGIQEEAAAQAAIGKQQEAILKGQAQAGADMLSKYQQQFQDLNDERQNFQHDVQNNKIDPNRYMGSQNASDRMMTSVGLILGGLGGGGSSNQALDFLNRQIDRDIDAQKANLGSSETLLSGNLRQFGNLRDATDMTKVMQNDLLINKLQQISAASAAPAAKARADQLAGQLQQQVAPLMQQLAMRQSLMQPGTNTSDQDPASFVPFVVPPDRQKDVLHEIGQAQDTERNAGDIMRHFDEAVKENSLGGRVMHAGFTPPSILAMRSQMLPIIHTAEGRVNEFEQKTTSDLEPKPGDTTATVAAKRQAMQQFLDQKAAAPNAKAFGIDLSRFKSTTTDEAARLSPQQQSFVAWARANPGNPKAQMVLKKLGVQ